MGGSEKGERASLIAVNTVAQYYEKEKKIDFLSIIPVSYTHLLGTVRTDNH